MLGLKISDFVFTTSSLGESKFNILTTTHCQKYFCNGTFSCASALGKKVFSTALVKGFFCRPQNTWILSFLLMQVYKWSRVTVWEQKISQNISYIERFKYVSIFQLRKKSFCLFKPQNTRHFSFLLVAHWESSIITVWVQKT